MIELILGIACGIALSLFFSFGPAFFSQLRTSIQYGFKKSYPFAFGVSAGDIVAYSGKQYRADVDGYEQRQRIQSFIFDEMVKGITLEQRHYYIDKASAKSAYYHYAYRFAVFFHVRDYFADSEKGKRFLFIIHYSTPPFDRDCTS